MAIREEEHVVVAADAYEHALLTVAQGVTAGLPHVMAWPKAAASKRPTVIYDINGQVLFYDFALIRGGEEVGYARMAANEIVGTPGVALEVGTRHWDFERAVAKLVPKVRREFGRTGAPRLVCYSYPKLGVLFEADGRRAIYDVASLDPVPERPEGDVEGVFAWSFFDSLSDRERLARRRRYRAFNEARRALSAERRRRMKTARSIETAIDVLGWEPKLKWSTTRMLPFCSHYNETEARSHHCFVLHAQQRNDYCAVATCQMVLCYYRYDYSQDHIAPALGYAPGGCPSDQSGGYKNLTCNHLDSSFDSSPTWEKARDEIEALHPFKSGVTGHARACAGYSSTSWILPLAITEKKLYIYDPWPWNSDLKLGGAVYWENWDSINHTNYVTTRINCP